jgi:protoporphyrin/coproporphyrin ferrochelatase
MKSKAIGVLLTNIGTPDAPTTASVRNYLKEFLSDTRVIEFPQLLWKPILYTFILTTRPSKTASLYQKIWTESGSPLLTITKDIARDLQNRLHEKYQLEIEVAIGMRYGNPSITCGLEQLKAKSIDHIIALPLYPQYSATTTASTFDAIANTFKDWRTLAHFRFINEYATQACYINALAESIKQHWLKQGKKFLLFSFHGIPQRYVDLGDTYAESCLATAHALTDKLELKAHEWTLTFQSRLGPTPWLQPYTDEVLSSLPKKGIEDIQVVCPGFPVDCLETLEEISLRGKEQFLAAGGKSFGYIPALNQSAIHIEMLAELLATEIQSCL